MGGRLHVNPNSSHRTGFAINGGIFSKNESVLKRPDSFAVNAKLAAGYPYVISESIWGVPLKYQSEAPFLVTADAPFSVSSMYVRTV